jgi:hypothetical protein
MTDNYSARKTSLRYKGKVVYEVTKILKEHHTIVDLCEKYKNDSGEECYRKIYY